MLLAAICCIIPKPQTSMSTRETHKVRDIPNKIRATPKTAG